ncbi:MAG: AI-2E family transporter [Ignavibacteria bacterium]|nr:AI-2E family transporter [Ignavibacteria bacterium]
MLFSEKQFNFLKKVFLIILALVVVIYLTYLLAEIIAMLIVALLIAMIFNPVVDFIEKRGIPRIAAVIFVFSLTGFLVFIGISFLMPRVVRQFNTIALIVTPENLNQLLNQVEKTIESLFPFLNSGHLINKLLGFIQNLLFGWINDISQLFYSIVSLIAILVIVPFLTFFLLKDNKRIISGMVYIMPNKYFEVAYWIINKISKELSRFVRGWIIDATLVGLMSGVGLALLGIQNAASIGFIAGVGHLIPYFGPVIGGVPAIIISIIQFGDFSMLPNIVLMFLIVYTIDNGFIQPHVFSKNTDLHPIVIILLILIGSKLLGVFGMLLAVPAATVIRTFAREVYFGYKNYKIIRM